MSVELTALSTPEYIGEVLVVSTTDPELSALSTAYLIIEAEFAASVAELLVRKGEGCGHMAAQGLPGDIAGQEVLGRIVEQRVLGTAEQRVPGGRSSHSLIAE